MFKRIAFAALALLISCLPLSGIAKADTATPVNLVPNPSLETSANGTAPDSWDTSNYSTVENGNDATFSYLNTGHDGSHSQEVQVTRFTDGDANWYYNDVPVTAGTTYQFSDWYQSNIDTEIDAEVVINGVSNYFKVGEAFANTGWTSFSSTFTAPAGATSMSLYHLIAGVGYLITDDYNLSAYTPSPFTRPLVSVTFDDGWLNQYQNAVPVLSQLGIPATFYIISNSSVTDPDPEYMNATQVKSLYTSGNEIGSHTVHHCDLTGLQTDDPDDCPIPITAAQVNSEMQDSQTTLQNLTGAPVTDFAYPYGAYSPETITTGEKYYQSQRTVNSGYDTKDSLDPTQLKMYEVDSDITVGQVEAWIDGAIANHTWLILTYHEVGTQPEDPEDDDALYTTQPTDFADEMAYLKSKTGVGIETVSQALQEAESQIGTTTPPIDTTAPLITNAAGVNITSTSATVDWTTDEASTSQVNYGPDTTYGSSTTLDPALNTTHAVDLTGLTPNTTYHFQIVSSDAANNPATSTDLTFTTLPIPDTAPPAVSDVTTSAITTSGANVAWITDEASTTQVNYGPDTTYGSSTTLDPALATTHGAALTGLLANTTYHFQVISTDAAGNTTPPTDFTFTTAAVTPPADTTPPVITDVTTSDAAQTEATINWITDEASTTQVNYGLTDSYGNSTTVDSNMLTSHSAVLTGLTPNTTYHFQVVSADAAGNLAPSIDLTFTTLADTVPTLIAGDVNGDGIVDALDLSTILSDWGKPNQTHAQGDVNNDGVVDALDLSTVLSKWSK